MGNCTVYTIDKNNEIVEQFKMDFNEAVGSYWGKNTPMGRYHIIPDGVECPYKKKKKDLKNIRRNQNHQES